MSALFDQNSAMMVVAGLLNDPSLIHDVDNFRLTVNDFHNEFYRIVFSAINNIVMEGAENVTPRDIDIYIGQYNKQYKIYKEQKGYEFLLSLDPYVMTMDFGKFSMHYNRLKKFTILRDLESAGINTKEFYNPGVSFLEMDKENEKLNTLTIDAIIAQVKNKLNKVEESYVSRTQSKSQEIGKGLRELYEELKETPDVGFPIQGDILNGVCRGMRFGKLFLNSAPSGHGKTRQMVGNACGISMPYIEGDKIIRPENLEKTVFIATEQQADEIQTLVLAYVSGVNEEKILEGTATAEEEKRIMIALDLIEKYSDNFVVEVIPDPSIALIRTKSIKHILNNDVHFIFYDYIFSSPGLLGEFRDLKIREDVALMMLSNTLKEIAAEYNIFVFSGTQLNDKWETHRVRNQNHIRGSKAIVDKVDFGMIAVKLSEVPDEMKEIEIMVEKAGLEMPNMVVDIYKNRRGKHASVKLFRYFDHGTCRVKDILLTTGTYKVIQDVGNITYATREVDLLDLAARSQI